MLRVIAAGLFFALACQSSAEASRNVVLLISDNHNQDDCGCYGNQVIKTPNIDRLAREGVRFIDAFATTASCGPSRAVIYSGLQTHSNGQYGHGHGIHTFRLLPKIQTIFALLKDRGYHTALLGKQHTTHPESYPFTFDKKVSGRDVKKLADVAGEFIQQAGDEPFFLTIGYNDPHPTSIERPGWGIKRHDVKNVPEVSYSPSDVIVPGYLPDRPEVREGLAGYYQEISRLDFGIGLILDLLKESGKEDETLVIFTSDHGSSEPGAMANHYDPGIRVPFVVRAPDGPQGTSDAMVTLADITPTILQWTDTPGPKYPLQGRSFLPVLGGDRDGSWDEVLLSHVCHEVTQYYPMRTIRGRRFKLIWNVGWRSEYPLPIDTLRRATWTEAVRRGDPVIGKRTVKKFLFRDQVELYDLQNDSDEIINLADDPDHQEIRRELSGRLVRWLEETEDPWLVRHRLPMPGEPESVSSRQANLDDATGFVSLFNGQNLDGWTLRRAERGGFTVEDGLLVCPAESGGYLFTNQEFGDFHLHFDFRLSPGANSGIAIRSPRVDAKPAYHGTEIQIIDQDGYAKPLKPTQFHGALYDVVASRPGALKPAGQWNHQQVWCKGSRVVVTVNDVVVLDVNLESIIDAETLKRHPGLQRTGGHIGLLGHNSRVDFRNLRIKEL